VTWELADLSDNRVTGGESHADLLNLIRELRDLDAQTAEARYQVIFTDDTGRFARYRLHEVLA